jgi:hypothetical protein
MQITVISTEPLPTTTPAAPANHQQFVDAHGGQPIYCAEVGRFVLPDGASFASDAGGRSIHYWEPGSGEPNLKIRREYAREQLKAAQQVLQRAKATIAARQPATDHRFPVTPFTPEESAKITADAMAPVLK